MNLQQMSYVKKVAETQSINKASRALHISQPALTKQIKLLETELGTTLFVRNKRGSILTKEGEFFIDEAKLILNKVQALKQQFTKQNENKVLNIAALPSIATHFLPNIIQKLIKKGYEFNIQVIDSSRHIMNLLLENKIDIGFGQDLEERDYTSTVITEPYYVVVPISSHLSKAQSISLSDLCEQQMILPALPCDIRKSLNNYLELHGIHLKKPMEVGQNDSILSLVKNNIGLTILPEMTIQSLDKELVAIPVENKRFVRKVSLITQTKKMNDLFKNSF